MDVGEKVIELFNVADYEKRIDGYRALNRDAVETGATIPLLQSVQTLVVRKKNLNYDEIRQRLGAARRHDAVDRETSSPAKAGDRDADRDDAMLVIAVHWVPAFAGHDD